MTSYFYLLPNWKSPKLACEVKGQDTSRPYTSSGENHEYMDNLSCLYDMTEIMLKVA